MSMLSTNQGRAILVNLISCHVSFLWRRPRAEHDHIDSMLHGLIATFTDLPCCLLGDWNDTPQDTALCQAVSECLAVRDADLFSCPRDGQRIDVLICKGLRNTG